MPLWTNRITHGVAGTGQSSCRPGDANARKGYAEAKAGRQIQLVSTRQSRRFIPDALMDRLARLEDVGERTMVSYHRNVTAVRSADY